jgi:hypothetical protein
MDGFFSSIAGFFRKLGMIALIISLLIFIAIFLSLPLVIALYILNRGKVITKSIARGWAIAYVAIACLIIPLQTYVWKPLYLNACRAELLERKLNKPIREGTDPRNDWYFRNKMAEHLDPLSDLNNREHGGLFFGSDEKLLENCPKATINTAEGVARIWVVFSIFSSILFLVKMNRKDTPV